MNTGSTQIAPAAFIVAPGEILEEWLSERTMTQRDLAQRLGASAKFVNQLIKGVATLSQETAVKLELVTGIPAYVWNRLEAAFREKDARSSVEEAFVESLGAFVDELPLATLRKWGFVTATKNNRGQLAHEILDFFGVASFESLSGTCLKPQGSFRTASTLRVDPWALAAWMRVGEMHSRDVSTAPFTRDGLLSVARDLPRLSRQPVEQYARELVSTLAEIGVAVVYVPEIPGARCYGVTRWEGEFRAVIQLSIRGKRDDQFWFTLMHEISHVLDGYNRQPFVDESPSRDDRDSATENPAEARANKFAADSLIPPPRAVELPLLHSLLDVEAFAQSIGVAPGIVVGRLQHEGLKNYNWGNQLRVRLAVGPSG